MRIFFLLNGFLLVASGCVDGSVRNAAGGDLPQSGDNDASRDDGSPSDNGVTDPDTPKGDSFIQPGVMEELLPPSTSPITTYCPFSDNVDLDSFEGRPVIRVCHAGDSRNGCDTNTLQEALSQAVSGDRIEIVGDGPPYTQCAVIPPTLSDVEIIGVCGRPHLKDEVCQSKGLFLNQGRDITITHVEISNLEISAEEGGNAAAVRDQSLGNLNLRYVYFHHNQNGILGGKGIVTIEWSKFESNGSSEHEGFAHNTYFSADVEELVIRNSLFLRARNQGNNMKSRAQKMLFECSVSASLDGVDSREMDLSEGGDVLIANSIVEQGPPSSNSNLIGFATESTDPDRRHSIMHLVIRNTDLINDRSGAGSFVQ
ncbi:MAG: hypothetical protein R3C68_09165, partial [Myxococcota bacterium]